MDGRRELKLSVHLYAYDVCLYCISEEDLKAMIGRLAKVCRGKGLKEQGDFVKWGGERWYVRFLYMGRDWRMFEYLGYVLDESGTDGVEYRKKVERGRKVVGAITILVNTRSAA